MTNASSLARGGWYLRPQAAWADATRPLSDAVQRDEEFCPEVRDGVRESGSRRNCCPARETVLHCTGLMIWARVRRLECAWYVALQI